MRIDKLRVIRMFCIPAVGIGFLNGICRDSTFMLGYATWAALVLAVDGVLSLVEWGCNRGK